MPRPGEIAAHGQPGHGVSSTQQPQHGGAARQQQQQQHQQQQQQAMAMVGASYNDLLSLPEEYQPFLPVRAFVNHLMGVYAEAVLRPTA